MVQLYILSVDGSRLFSKSPSVLALLCSLMSGLSSMESKACCRMGVLTVTYYLWTTFIAVVVGILLVIIIKPGVGTEMESNRLGGGPVMTSADALLDLIRCDRSKVSWRLWNGPCYVCGDNCSLCLKEQTVKETVKVNAKKRWLQMMAMSWNRCVASRKRTPM